MDHVTVVTSGVRATSTGTAVSSALPRDSEGTFPNYVHVTATAAGYIKVGDSNVTATSNDILVQPSDGINLCVAGCTWFSFVSETGTAKVSVTPCEAGGWNNITNLPTLDLQFSRYSSLGAAVTFTRASSATYFNSAGVLTSAGNNAARFDYDPITLACKGLLIEEQRTNLLTYSETFSDASWVKVSSTILSGKLVEAAASADHYLSKTSATFTASTQLTATAVILAGERASGQLRITNSNGTFGAVIVAFNLATGVVGTPAIAGTATAGQAKIRQVESGSFEITLTGTLAGDVTAGGIQVYTTQTYGGSTTYLGDGTSGFTPIRTQLEAGSFATSYIPTTSAQVTRAADVAVISTLTPWFNASEGAVFAEVDSTSFANFPTVVRFTDGTDNNAILFNIRSSGAARIEGAVSSVAWATVNTANLASVNTAAKMAWTYKASDQAADLSGGTVTTGANSSIPSVNTVRLGAYSASGAYLNGHIKRLAYYPRRLSNTELQGLTA